MVASVNLNACVEKEKRNMLKKLIRLTVAMIFGSLILMNLSLASLSGSVTAAEAARGTSYVGPAGDTVCICSGSMCRPCATIQELQKAE